MTRRSSRVKMVVPVKVAIKGASGSSVFSAQTVDVSAYGARLSNVIEPLGVGQALTITHEKKDCRFRVAWVGGRGTSEENHIGLECLETEENFWGLQFQDEPQDGGEIPSYLGVSWHVSKAS